MQKNGIICFFYVNNIVFAFKKEKTNEIKKIMISLLQILTIKKKKELK